MKTIEQTEDAFDDMRSELQSGECVTINAADEIYFCGKRLAVTANRNAITGETWPADDAKRFAAIRAEMERRQFWPNIYRVNDHGNISLLSHNGKELAAWV